MLKNHLTIASRNFWRHKAFSVINVLGLSIGICAALVIFLIVHYEFSYDKIQPGGDRIFRVVLDARFNGIDGHSTGVPAPLGAAIENEVTGVEQRLAHKPTLYGLLAIAGFLLLLGCINFINLTTANASQRAKEIGIRKTMGSSRKQLVFQFLCETFLLTFSSTILSVILTPFILKAFAGFIPPGVSFDWANQPAVFLFLLLLVILVSFLSGFYPALILSGYKTINVLKNQSSVQPGETRHAWVRKTLTVSQFVIAQFFIIATVMVGEQINYSLNADLGFKKEAILTFHTPREKETTQREKGSE